MDGDTEKEIPTMGSRALTFGDIDRVGLALKTSNRPKTRHLYFHYVIASLWLLEQTQR